MITQKTTYYPNYAIKSYKEFNGDKLIVHNKYDKQGNIIYSIDKKGEWTKKRFDKNNNEIYSVGKDGNWTKYKYDKNNEIKKTSHKNGDYTEWGEKLEHEGWTEIKMTFNITLPSEINM